MALIKVKDVFKYYPIGDQKIKALGPVDLEIFPQTFNVILGRSGSGKSTLLNLLAGLDKVSSGTLEVEKRDLSKANSRDLAKYRSSIGIIFQSYHLLPNLDTVENVLMGAWAGGGKADKKEAWRLLSLVGLEHRLQANVKTLSGGEKQRVAVCRSLISKPNLLFCDEPTGALDTKNEEQIKNLLVSLNREDKKTIVMVTHNPDFAELADNVIYMQDGLIERIQSK